MSSSCTYLPISLALFILLDVCISEMREYCFPNAFNVSCARDEVVLVTAARYGRIKKGVCLTTDYHMGCGVDVVKQVDRKCSGRHRCLISIPDNDLHNLQPCPKDMLAYLEADYVCQKVQTRSPFPCHLVKGLIVAETPGYLASVIADEYGFGSPRCPWVIVVPRGRNINLTLIDFAVSTRYPEPRHNNCHVYAKVREPHPSAANEATVCGGRTRERHVYTSQSPRVEIVMASVKFAEEQIYFFLKYEAIGCGDPALPKAAWFERTNMKATISCNFTAQIWHIVCQNGTWFGAIDNCTSDGLPVTSSRLKSAAVLYSAGIFVAVFVGLLFGVITGVTLLTLFIACHKRNPGFFRKSRSQQNDELSLSRNHISSHDDWRPLQGCTAGSQWPVKSNDETAYILVCAHGDGVDGCAPLGACQLRELGDI